MSLPRINASAVLLGTLLSLAAIAHVGAARAKLEWVRPVGGSVSYGYFDPRYHQGDALSDKRQHLGSDLRGKAGQSVIAPVSGTVVVNNTSVSDIMQAYLVIKDSATGHDHVLGHITSSYRKGQKVEQGQIVGSIRDWGSNSHVHWGVNSVSVESAQGWSSEGQWGWGRAPFAATASQAASRGWIDPFSAGATILSSPSSANAQPPSPASSSTTRSSSRGSLPATPQRMMPGKSSPPGTTLPGSRIVMTWGSVAGATTYELRVRDMTDRRSAANETMSQTYYSLGVRAGHTYRWSVRACNDSGCSASSDDLYFTAR